MDVKYFIVLVFVLSITEQIFSKSIQNITSLEEDTINSRLELLETKLTLLENERGKQPVLFYAIIKQSEFSLNKYSTVVFETIIINEGGHYNNNDGIFVALRDGIYMFSWTVCTVNAAYIIMELVVEEKVISSTGEKEVDSSSYSSASMTAFCRMNKDEHAWIRTTGWNTENYIHSKDQYSRTSFLGLLIH
ncbi:complement C1q tumor necrosis factor-related protein 1-like [Mytilus californianus]|uniref:complement C1q tumor necrosis factor-related protein 1-like n=1 Tax=Mytilus californianus TaxID=6549 RepID=UPI00224825E9|nr:complement C1q tumor necrosis factor-related protein 1-like [Mytilus californianus]